MQEEKENKIPEGVDVPDYAKEEKSEKVNLEAEVKTQVTSIAQEEARTGQKIEMPSAEELVQRASLGMVQSLQQIEHLFNTKDPRTKLSSKKIRRALIAGLQLPTDGMPVTLKSNEEKLLFGLIQRIISDRFIILQHHISQEMKKAKQEEEEKQAEAQQAEVEEEIQKEDSNE